MKIIHIKQNITLYEIMNLRNHSKFIEIKKANNIPDDFTGILEFETFGSYGCFQVYFHNGCLGNDNGSWFHSNSSTEKYYAVLGDVVPFAVWKRYKKANGTTLAKQQRTTEVNCFPSYRPTEGVYNRIGNVAWQIKDEMVYAVYNFNTKAYWTVGENFQTNSRIKRGISEFQYCCKDNLSLEASIKCDLQDIIEILKTELKNL